MKQACCKQNKSSGKPACTGTGHKLKSFLIMHRSTSRGYLLALKDKSQITSASFQTNVNHMLDF